MVFSVSLKFREQKNLVGKESQLYFFLLFCSTLCGRRYDKDSLILSQVQYISTFLILETTSNNTKPDHHSDNHSYIFPLNLYLRVGVT